MAIKGKDVLNDQDKGNKMKKKIIFCFWKKFHKVLNWILISRANRSSEKKIADVINKLKEEKKTQIVKTLLERSQNSQSNFSNYWHFKMLS